MTIFYRLNIETPQPGGLGSCIYFPRNMVAQLYPQVLDLKYKIRLNNI
jgi:hypothetical protein